MAITHRAIYKNVAAALNLKPEDDYIEVGCGSGIFMKLYASHVQSIAGLDHSEDMVKLLTRYNQKRVEEDTADQILVIDDSKVVEQGKHSELLSKDGLYNRFWEKRQKARGWKVARKEFGGEN